MKHLTLLVLALFLSLTTASHAAQDRVVAVVNSSIITQGQVMGRTNLRIRQLGLDNPTAQQTDGLARRTLGDMIDEELQRQYAETIGITITDDMVKRASTQIKADNPVLKNLPKAMESTLAEQVRAELRWANITANVVQPQVEISNAETDQIINDMTKSRHVIEREISQIFMSVEGDTEAATRTRMEGVMAELQAGKTDFATLARTHSDDKTSAANGGNMGWFGAGQLNPQLEEALAPLQPGQTSGLIRTPLGFHVLRIENVRTTKPIDTAPIQQLHLIAIARPLAEGETEDAAFNTLTDTIIKPLRKSFQLEDKLTDPTFRQTWPESADLGWVNPTNLQSALQQVAGQLQQGQWSAPFIHNGNVTALFLADTRQAISPQLEAYRARVREHLLTNRLELASRRLMRDLRAKAFVDIRW